MPDETEGTVLIKLPRLVLHGDLQLPRDCRALVLLVHGSGSSRLSPRNRDVAGQLRQHGLGTLLFDLLGPREAEVDERTRHYRFDIRLLAERLVQVLDWSASRHNLRRLRLGLLGASTGAAAALVAAAERPLRVGAVVSRDGRPDLAAAALPRVSAPTLLIVCAADPLVLQLHRDAARQLRCEHRLEVVAGATHRFEEPGTLEQASALAARWLESHLQPAAAAAADHRD